MVGTRLAQGRPDAAPQLHGVQHVPHHTLQNPPQHLFHERVVVGGPASDGWEVRGLGGTWIRKHNTLRSSLFTPMKVAKGPTHGTHLAKLRRTEGTFVTGEKFTIYDDWTDADRAHRVLKDKWTGTTTFIEYNPEAGRTRENTSWDKEITACRSTDSENGEQNTPEK